MKPVVVLLIALVVGGAAFYGGIQYDKNQQTGSARGGFAAGVGRTGARRTGSGQPVSGEILNMDDSSITVKLADGSSRIVLLSDKTIFNKTSTVDKSELKVGTKVGVFGTTNTDGSITAQNVQLNPQFRMGAGAGAGTTGTNATGSAR